MKCATNGDAQKIEELFEHLLPQAMKSFLDRISKANNVHNKAVEHYTNSGWPCELVFTSQDPSQPPLRLVTNIKYRKWKGHKAEVLLRDPSVMVKVMQPDFIAE